MTEEILNNLNSQQKEAVTATEGPLLILAGAGSGKTRALTHRLSYLIKKGVPPANILALTFTNKAAEEMRERAAKLLGIKNINHRGARLGDGRFPFVGTFHALGARILRSEMGLLGRPKDFTIYDSKDQRALVKEVMAGQDISIDKFKPGGIIATFSAQKNELVEPALYEKKAKEFYEKIVSSVWLNYEKALRQTNAVDFDDLLMLPVKIFKNFPKTLEKYQRLFKYILVDEYQDTNHAQYVFLNLLASKHRNICVVGDDWQAVYGFRGADFRNIFSFEKDYPEAKVVLLEENYRSTQNILDAAQAIIEKNTLRTEKNLWTKKKSGKKVL